MDSDVELELFSSAEEHFKADEYALAEPILNQLVLKNTRKPEVFHMLGTIYYDQSKFNKAIRSFKRALEIDSSFTDSSIGLSIILNDLGRYEEGQKVFDEARAMLAVKGANGDSKLNETFSSKHDELGELYLRHHLFSEALEQFKRAYELTTLHKPDVGLRIAECYVKMNNVPLAIRELRLILREQPHNVAALLKLGKCYYDNHDLPEAIEKWETVLKYEPKNPVATDYLRLVQSVQVTNLNAPNIDL